MIFNPKVGDALNMKGYWFVHKKFGGIGSDQAKLPILHFIHSNTLGFPLQYLSFRHQKGHYRVAGSPEVQNLPYFSELDGQPQSYPFGF
jgi:hypothetical protein